MVSGSMGKPDAITAASGALAPGIGSTAIPRSAQAATSSTPGSDTPGVPASVTSATPFAALEPGQNLRKPRPGVVFVEAQRWGGDSVMREELCRSPRVFRRDHGRFPQHPQRAECDVLEVADRRGDHEQGAGHRTGSLMYHCEMRAHRPDAQSASYDHACTHRSHFRISSTITSRICTRSFRARPAWTASTCMTTCSRT